VATFWTVTCAFATGAPAWSVTLPRTVAVVEPTCAEAPTAPNASSAAATAIRPNNDCFIDDPPGWVIEVRRFPLSTAGPPPAKNLTPY